MFRDFENGEDHLYVRGTFQGLTQFLDSREICEEYRFFPFYIMIEGDSLQAYYHLDGKGHNALKERFGSKTNQRAIQAQINTEIVGDTTVFFRVLHLNITNPEIEVLDEIMPKIISACQEITSIRMGRYFSIVTHFNSTKYTIRLDLLDFDRKKLEQSMINAFSKMVADHYPSISTKIQPHADPSDRAFIYYINGEIYTGLFHTQIIGATEGNSSFESIVRGEIFKIKSQIILSISMADERFIEDSTLEALIPKLRMYLEIYPDIFLDFKASPNSTFMPKYLRDYFTKN